MIVSRKIFKDKKSFIAKEGIHLLSKQDNSEHQASITGITPMPSTFQLISNTNQAPITATTLPININSVNSVNSVFNPSIKTEN